MARAAHRAENILSLKVTLRGIRPPVWRRLIVPGTMTLADLHRAIQAAMGWEDQHLHVFHVAGRPYGDPHTVDDVADEDRLTMNGVVKSGVARFYLHLRLRRRLGALDHHRREAVAATSAITPPASPESATAPRRIAEGLGATRNYSPFWPTPRIQDTATGSR